MLDQSVQNITEIIIAGLIFFFIEKLKPSFKTNEDIKKEKRLELLLAIFNASFVAYIIIALSSLWIEYVLQPLTWYQILNPVVQHLPVFIQLFIAAAILDLAKYWQHRLSHKYIWNVHAIHHSAKQLTWITGLRLHPIEIAVAAMFDATFLYILGFEGDAIIMAIIFLKALNFMIHSNLDLKYTKPFRYLLASPHYHRWHHANIKEAYDKNFAGAFPFWDLLFGTYYCPEEDPPGYGLSKFETKHYPSHNVIGWLLYPFKRKK